MSNADDFYMQTHAEGLEAKCSRCGDVLHFGLKATVEGVREGKREHLLVCAKVARFTRVDDKLVAIDGTTVYFEILGGGKLQIVPTALNRLLGNAGAWRWRFEGTDEDAGRLVEAIRRVLRERAAA